jgi:hypothetical protein
MLVLQTAAGFIPSLFQTMPLLAAQLEMLPASLHDEVSSFCRFPRLACQPLKAHPHAKGHLAGHTLPHGFLAAWACSKSSASIPWAW